jgi:hypothetical protein
MAIKAGFGGLAGNDALIFGYDIGDLYNSYRGEPTTNLLYAGDPSLNSQITWTNSGEWTALDNDTDVDKPIIPGIDTSSLKIMSGRSITTGSQHIGCAYITSLSPSTTYTISVWFRQNRAGSNQPYFRTNINNNSFGNFLYNGNTDASTWPVNQWIRISATGTLQADENGAYLSNYIGGQVGDKVWYFAPQVEQKSHATALALGTRSSTQGLLNFRGNNTIDLSSVSFDNNGKMLFDGSDDIITFSNSTILPIPNHSFEMIFKTPGYGATESINGLLGLTYGTYVDLRGAGTIQYIVYNTDAGYPGTYTVSLNSGGKSLHTNLYYHVVCCRSENSTAKIYINGQLEAQSGNTGTWSGTDIWSGMAARIGSNPNDSPYNFNGYIDVVNIYNRELTAQEISQNFNNYKRRFAGLDDITDSVDGGGWHRFWWYLGAGWPSGETGAFAHPYGTFSQSSPYGFQRLPSGLTKSNIELLAKDGDGNVYKWDFANASSTAQRVWDSMTAGTQGAWADGGAFNPIVIAGAFHGVQQDTWQYRVSEGFTSFLLDDDTCDCYSTLNAGHAMCGTSGWNQTYAQPDGAYLRYGVDTLNDGGCLGPIPTRRLELFYRVK